MTKVSFGTDGIRGLADKDITVSLAQRLGLFFTGKKVLVGMDVRESSKRLSEAICKGVEEAGGHAVELGYCTTPSLCYLTSKFEFDYGVMVTASHNPSEYNGLKVVGPNGGKIPYKTEVELQDFLNSDDMLLQGGGSMEDGSRLLSRYVSWVRSKADGSIAGLKVLFDCANGSTSTLAKSVFEGLVEKADFIFDEPDGFNVNKGCGATHMEALAEAIKGKGYDIGFSFDGDGDRCLCVFGDGVVPPGDASMLGIAAKLQKPIVFTVMSSKSLGESLDKLGIPYAVSKVGDRNVYELMKDKGYPLGGEESGHFIFGEDLPTGDGFLTAIRIMQAYVTATCRGQMESFRKWPCIRFNVKTGKRKGDKIDAVVAKWSSFEEEGSNVLIRKSGTEPLLRVFAESKDEERLEELENEIREDLRRTCAE